MKRIYGEAFLNALKYVETESQDINDIVDQIVKRFSKELDEFVMIVRDCIELVKQTNLDMYDNETLQMQILKLPTLLYFAGDGLEVIGGESEVAEYRRKELYNEIINSLNSEKYTIPDKKAMAEKQTEYEAIVERIYDRAYKKLKLKIDLAIKLLESLKKVADMRIARMNKGKGYDNGGDEE